MELYHHTADEAIEIFQAATQANLLIATREGNVIQLDETTASDVILTGDLHGHEANYQKILQAADLDRNPRRHLVFQELCHGGEPYPNGGCRSHLLVENIARLKVKYPDRVHHITSNHELAELVEYPIQKCSQLLNLSFSMGMEYCYGNRAGDVRIAMLGYLESCPLAVRITDSVFFSHSIPEGLDRGNLIFDRTVFYRPYDPCSDFLLDGSVYRLVWGRDYRQENADAFAAMVGAEILVCGHDPCLEGVKYPNSRQAVLDCCADQACYMVVPVREKLTTWNYRTCVRQLGK